MKKAMAVLLAVLLVLGSMSCLADGERAKVGNVYVDGEYPICDETIELSVATSINGTDIYGLTHEKKAWVIEMQDALNVKINWITLAEGVNERKAVMLASGDMPDVFGGGWLTDVDIVQNTQLFVPLEDMLPEYGPNIIANLEAVTDGAWRRCMTYPDGRIYSIMGGNWKSIPLPSAVPFWRQSWLDAVGKSIPTTTQELYDVLAAFRDAKLGGDTTIPMEYCEAHWASTLSYLFGVYGITAGSGKIKDHYYTMRDGKVIGWADSQNLYDALTFIHTLVADGLLNPEGLTETPEQYQSNLSSGICGSAIMYGTEIVDEDLAMDYVLQSEKILAPGYEDQFLLSSNAEGASYSRNNWTITTACAEPIAALRVWDYMSQSQDFAYYIRYGKDGLICEKIDGRYTEVNHYLDEGFTVESLKAFYSAEDYPWIYEDTEDITAMVYSQIFQNPPLLQRTLWQLEPVNVTTNRRLFTMYYYGGSDWVQQEKMASDIITAEERDALEFECDGLAGYIDSFIANAILDGFTDEQWEDYVNGISGYGYDYYIDWYQNYLDGTLAGFVG